MADNASLSNLKPKFELGMPFIRAQSALMENLKKNRADLLTHLKKIEDKRIALRAAIKRQNARLLDASQSALRKTSLPSSANP
jgi:hypothetical protein